MNYFRLNFQAKGHYPQHQGMGDDYDYGKENSVHKLSNSSFLNTDPDFNFIYFKGNSKLTDFISSAPISSNWGFIVSQKVLEIFKKFNLPEYKTYKVPVIYKKEEIDNYYFINILLRDLNFNIDYTTSKFFLLPNGCIRDDNDKPIKYIPPTGERCLIETNNLDDYKRTLWHVLSNVETELNVDNNLTLDLFKILPFSNAWIVSEPLVNEMVKNKVTGIEIKPIGKSENYKSTFVFRR